MIRTLKLPGVPPQVSSVLVHFALVFSGAFSTQLLAGLAGSIKVSTLLALLTSASVAGVVAVVHVALGLIPQADQDSNVNSYGVSLVIRSRAYQFLTSIAVIFLSTLGAQLISGATHITSLPDVTAVILAAIAAGSIAVVQLVIGLIPSPRA
jgi:hypothetical protein